MNQLRNFTLGLAVAFGLPWLFLVVVPWAKMRDLSPVPYTEEDGEVEAPAFPPGPAGRIAAGHRIYAEQGCAYCHTQMVRPTYAGSDLWRQGWGGREEDGMQREPHPRDYLGEPYAFLGVHRNGPDLSNVGWRHPDAAWHHLHFYNPRAINKWSIMPSFDHLYLTRKIEGRPAENALLLPPEFAPPAGYEVVPTTEAEALVDYVLGLKKDYKLPLVLRQNAAVPAGGSASASVESSKGSGS